MTPTDPKLIQALIDNHLGTSREGDIALVFGLRWEPLPEKFRCPHCKGALERTVGLMLASPWAGGSGVPRATTSTPSAATWVSR